MEVGLLPKRFHIGWHNDLDDLTLSSVPAATPAHPVERLRDPMKGRPARWSMGAGTLQISGTTSSDDRAATGLLIKGHNIAGDATVRLRLYNGEAGTGDVVYDSDDHPGAGAMHTLKGWGEMVAGIDPWGGAFDGDSGLDPVFALTWPTVRYQSFRLDIAVPNPVNGVVEIDKLALFLAWSPPYGYERGDTTAVDDASEHVETRAGGIRTIEGPIRRRLDLDFAYMNDIPRNILMDILVRARKSGDLYIIGNPSWTGYSKFMSSSIFRRDNDASYQTIVHNGSNLALRLREN